MRPTIINVEETMMVLRDGSPTMKSQTAYSVDQNSGCSEESTIAEIAGL